MTKAPFLFIGGSKDGQRLYVTQDHVSFTIDLETFLHLQNPGNSTREHYSIFFIQGELQEHIFYVLDRLTADDFLRVLIQNYQTPVLEKVK